jgi:hypothetical protein
MKRIIILVVYSFQIITFFFVTQTLAKNEEKILENKINKKNLHYISTGIAIPLNGTLYLAWGKPVSEKIVLSNYLAYFDRDWMVLLKKGDWHSRSFYYGLAIQYFPFSKERKYEGFYIGGDIGMAVSYQTYKPLNKSDLFFFFTIDGYFLGYIIPLWDSLKIDFLIGGGYAPVSQEVKIDGHVNEGDFYPLLNIQLSYWR